MPRQRNLKLDEYQISKAKYLELKYFCMQYQEKKAQLSALSLLSGVTYSGMPSGSGISSPTENHGLLMARLSGDIEMIESAAKEVCGEIYGYMLDNVTQGISYHYLNVPCSKKYFYKRRRMFFHRLAQKRV